MILTREHTTYGTVQYSIAEMSEGFLAINGFKEGVQVDRITYVVSNLPQIEETIQVEKTRLVIQKQPGLQAGDPIIETTVEESYFEEEKTGKMLPNPQYVDLSDLSKIYKRLKKKEEFL